jgi:hypothetical protein
MEDLDWWPDDGPLGVVGAIGGSLLLVIAKERMVSTPPLLVKRDTKHARLSTKYFRSFFMCLQWRRVSHHIVQKIIENLFSE